MAVELLDRATDMLDDRQVTAAQLRYVVARLAEALRDVYRIAERPGCTHRAPDRKLRRYRFA
jgi:hypothetical protein